MQTQSSCLVSRPIPNSEFTMLGDGSRFASPLFEAVRTFFQTDLSAALGREGQENEFRRVEERKNRECYVLSFDGVLGGFVVMKDRYDEHPDCLMVSNLCCVVNEVASLKEVADLLLNKSVEVFRDRNQKRSMESRSESSLLTTIHVKIPATHDRLAEYLKEKNFVVLKTETNRSLEPKSLVLAWRVVSASSGYRIPKRSRDEETTSAPAVRDEAVTKVRAVERTSSENKEGVSSVSSTLSRQPVSIPNPSSVQRSMTVNPMRNINPNPTMTPKIHSATLMRKYILQIRDGVRGVDRVLRKKTIEGRINSGMFLNFKVNDLVRFFYYTDPRDDVVCRITKIVKYSCFREMLSGEGVQNCLADVSNLEDAVRIYDNIPGYREKAARFGVLAIQLEVMSGERR